MYEVLFTGRMRSIVMGGLSYDFCLQVSRDPMRKQKPTVYQIDFEHGEQWNSTPVRTFEHVSDAIQYVREQDAKAEITFDNVKA